MGWQWHQLDDMQCICTSLQTDNHASTSRLSFYRLDTLPAAHPTASKHWRQKHCWTYIISYSVIFKQPCFHAAKNDRKLEVQWLLSFIAVRKGIKHNVTHLWGSRGSWLTQLTGHQTGVCMSVFTGWGGADLIHQIIRSFSVPILQWTRRNGTYSFCRLAVFSVVTDAWAEFHKRKCWSGLLQAGCLSSYQTNNIKAQK